MEYWKTLRPYMNVSNELRSMYDERIIIQAYPLGMIRMVAGDLAEKDIDYEFFRVLYSIRIANPRLEVQSYCKSMNSRGKMEATIIFKRKPFWQRIFIRKRRG